MAAKRSKWNLVPHDLMVRVADEVADEIGISVDSWLDSHVELARARLGSEYWGVPLDQLKNRWITLRKGDYLKNRGGKGPSVGWKRQRLEAWGKAKGWDSEAYRRYLQSPEWKRKRSMALDRDGHRCRVCNAGHELEVHHRCYPTNGWGTESIDDLTTLCSECHNVFHDAILSARQRLFR